MLRIAELYASIQGEGLLAETPSVFVRTTGCNLRCRFCDTPHTSWTPEGLHQAWPDVLARVAEFGLTHVVVTGGEPLLQPDVVPLSQALWRAGFHVTIETAGTVDRNVWADLMSLSPKLGNSTPDDALWSERHESLRSNRKVVARLLRDYDHQVKFVVDRPEDVVEIDAWLAAFPQVAPQNVWLLPQSIRPEEVRSKTAWLAPLAESRGWSVSPRLHIERYGNVRAR